MDLQVSDDERGALYRTMVRIRAFEETAKQGLDEKLVLHMYAHPE